jgi:hypothetical protein
MAEKSFEYLLLKEEATRGTAETAPAYYLALDGMLTPRAPRASVEESDGTLAARRRSIVTRKWSEWEGTGALDFYVAPVLYKALVKGSPATTTPTDAVLTRLHTFAPTMTADDLKSLTAWWGDPNNQILRTAFTMVDEVTITSDATTEDPVQMSVSGQGHFPEKVADPTLPTQLVSPLAIPGSQQLWIDLVTVGTTAIDTRFLSGEATIPGGITYKYGSQGPENNLQFVRIGRTKRSIEVTLRFELLDMDQYDLFVDGEILKIRWRINGPLIETENATDFYFFHEIEFYAPVDSLEWSLNEDSNRVADLTFISEYDATAARDWLIRVQNDRATV